MDNLTFEITDDSGFLALVDPDAYSGFVDEDWQLPQLIGHFKDQMQSRRLLIWGTDLENVWRVRVQFEPAHVSGFREVVGPITASKGRLLLTNYESLTMAAQFEDTTLPQPHEHDQLLQIEPGTYRCRIIQLHNHADTDDDEDDETDVLEDAEVHYILELLRSSEHTEAWQEIPWSPV